MHRRLRELIGIDLARLTDTDLDRVERNIADIERDIDIVRQRLPPRIREKFEAVSVDLRELRAIKEKVTKERQRRRQTPTPPPRR